MKVVKVKKNGILLHDLVFEKDEDAIDFLTDRLSRGCFGLPGEFEIFETDVIVDFDKLRKDKYKELTDPSAIEAFFEYFEGKPDKLNNLLELRQQIKKDFPRPFYLDIIKNVQES